MPDSYERRNDPCRSGRPAEFRLALEGYCRLCSAPVQITVSAMRWPHPSAVPAMNCTSFHPGDDTTVACMRIISSKPVHLMTGPARNPEDDTAMVHDFMSDPDAATIVCGGIQCYYCFQGIK